MHFPPSAVERAMKVRDVIVRAISGDYTWWLGRDPIRHPLYLFGLIALWSGPVMTERAWTSRSA